jgi:hypothetical protein
MNGVFLHGAYDVVKVCAGGEMPSRTMDDYSGNA